MILKIHLKQISQRKQAVAPVDFDQSPVPRNVRELIAQTVTMCVNEYNERVRRGDSLTAPVTEE